MNHLGLYKDSFVIKLENEIREIESSIDIVNLSY